jgi:hypothetical protein
MRKILAAVLLLSMSGGAMAIERYDSRSMTCSAIQAALEKDGAAILYRQTSGLPLYDRYVASSRFCDSTATAVWSSVPASDTATCRVRKCKSVSRSSY